MDETPLPSMRFKRYWKHFARRVLIYLAAYVIIASLTIGPFFWLWFEAVYAGGPTWIAKFYTPLLWLCDRIGWLSYLVNGYINWWIL